MVAWTAFLGLSIWSWREAARGGNRRLIGLAILLMALALVLPERVGGHGGYLVMRLALIAIVTALGGFALPPRPWLRSTATAAMRVLMVASLAALITHYLSGLQALPRGRVFIPVVERRSPFRMDPLAHVNSYYAMATDGIDLGKYEADLYYFPVRFAPTRRDPPTLQRRFDTVDMEETSRLVDALLIWGSVPASVQASVGFHRAFSSGLLSIFVSTKREAPAAS